MRGKRNAEIWRCKASGSIDSTGRERLLPNQRQARQEPRSPLKTLGRYFLVYRSPFNQKKPKP